MAFLLAAAVWLLVAYLRRYQRDNYNIEPIHEGLQPQAQWMTSSIYEPPSARRYARGSRLIETIPLPPRSIPIRETSV